MTSKQIVNVLLIIFAIGALVYLFRMNKINRSVVKGDGNYREDTIVDSQSLFDSPKGEVSGYEGAHTLNSPVVAYENRSNSIGCPIENTDNELKEYYNRLYGTRDMSDREKANMALCEHTDFRGKINASSDQFGSDAVDRVNALYLSGNGSDARRHQGKTIREVYDGLTDQTNLVVRHNIRLPDFEANNCAIANVV